MAISETCHRITIHRLKALNGQSAGPRWIRSRNQSSGPASFMRLTQGRAMEGSHLLNGCNYLSRTKTQTGIREPVIVGMSPKRLSEKPS